MFLMIFILAAACMWIEMKLVVSIPVLGAQLERFRIASLVFSLMLSMGLGVVFGAEGLIVFASGILSTIMIQPWYAMRKNGTMDKVHVQREKTRQSYSNAKNAYVVKRDVYTRRTHQVMDAAKFVGLVIALPFIVFGKILDVIDRMTNKVSK